MNLNTLHRLFMMFGRGQDTSENPYYSQFTQKDEQSPEERIQSLQSQQIALDIYDYTGLPETKSIFQMIRERSELGKNIGPRSKVNITQRYLPHQTQSQTIYTCPGRAFCGRFSADGSVFLTASTDGKIRLFETNNWNVIKTSRARDIQWSIIDTDYSPDGRWIIYSSWSNYIHMCNRVGEEATHEALEISRSSQPARCCFFSIRFSSDSREIIAGNTEPTISIYNLDRRQTVNQFRGHENDINSVGFIDGTSQVFVSGSDDFLIKVWDRRSSARHVGTLVGHLHGVTHIDSKGDGRYLISNGKDQCIKLWDLRKMSSDADPPAGQSDWDYRYGAFHAAHHHRELFNGTRVHRDDQSIMSYRGHQVFQTLIRSYFSPLYSTGQRYIYTGSADGCIYIYDVLTGEIVERLQIHNNSVVRDVSWHPFDCAIVSSSWDRTVKLSTPFFTGTHTGTRGQTPGLQGYSDDDDDDDDGDDDGDDSEIVYE
eukprot:TRINITY_DN821_c0_g4_i1.p1 TRINITY_DN821_c0_g4~~TRINITY_DN821_c0_g4_i1.p1  ORF type:complete len:484 (-),score=75.44 TRINITY_DN821_c0_g4_i1:17-1468(-)